jgi:type VI secretion system protein ImpB
MATKRESTQQTLSRVRAPRVHITYEVEKGGAIENKELPFSLAVVGDFASQENVAEDKKTKVKDRKFVSVDQTTFDNVLSAMAPKTSFRVKNVITEQSGEFGVNLEFNALDDFSPEAVVQQVEPLKKLVELRAQFSNLRSKVVSSEKLEDGLMTLLKNTEQVQQLAQEAGGNKE